MLLTIDIGNTQTALGLFEGDRVVAHWRLNTIADRTEDELRISLTGLFDLEGYRLAEISGIALASVVPALTAAFRTVGHSITDGPVVAVGPGVKTGMPILIDNPREVGADRIANAVAARERHGTPVIVVDFGTSTNFDVISAGGEYLGGVIAPGLHIATNALISGTAALRRVEYVAPRSPIGKGTVEAIQSGALYGHAGLVDGIMERVAAELGDDITRIATGGLASTIVPHCSSVSTIDDFLTLEGLRTIYELNTT
ncbi:MAG: type III pantothenate kinase [Actinomycetota bacterium]|nr:type III pantothenate kinase [Actinomycetota bacterium]